MFLKPQLKKISLFFLLIKDRLLGNNKSFDTKDIKSLVLFVGPYRNLTTYLAANIALHPQCQVLNHAGIRVFSWSKINFLHNYTNEKFQNFLRYFNYANKSGYRGIRGGNIIYSHAFESNPELKKLYHQTPQNSTKTCMVWKESHVVTNHLMQHKKDLEKILKENIAVKFLFPVRHPLDCATSNIKTKKFKLFSNNINPDVKEVSKAIFNQYLFFLALQKDYPTRISFVFENKISADSIKNLCEFFEIKKDSEWQRNMLGNYKIKPSYQYSEETIAWCKAQIDNLFGAYPSFQTDLKNLIEKSAN